MIIELFLTIHFTQLRVIKMIKLLIVGGAGQVGRELSIRAPHSWNVRSYDKYQLDITDSLKTLSVVCEFLPDIIINASAYTAVDKAETEPPLCYEINENGAKNLAVAANTYGAKLIHISTDYVFSGEKDGSYDETDVPDPKSVYGLSKLAGEKAIEQNCPEHIIIRTSWVFGEFGNNFVKTMLRLSLSKLELSIVADQFGSPTHAGQLADAILNIASRIKNGNTSWGTYHYSGVPYTNWSDFARKIFSVAFEKNVISNIPLVIDIPSSQFPTLAQRPKNSKLCCNKIKQTFGLSPCDWRSALLDLDLYVLEK